MVRKMGNRSVPPASLATFGDLLKYLRKRAQLSQRELAIAVGYSDSQISRLEANLRTPDRASLLALFVPALLIEDEPEMVARLLELAQPGYEKESIRAVVVPEKVHPHNLPDRLTSFIGRQKEIAELHQLLTAGPARLVTLTGSGGVGKTRLAMQVGEALLGEFEDGVWLVELAPLTDPALVAQEIASILGLSQAVGQAITQSLCKYLSGKHLLLIIDNCEHLINAAASLANALLHTCPRLRILATSRETLAVEGEMPFRCPSLQLPNEVSQPDLAAMEKSEAVQLFIERTRAARPDFMLTEADAPVVVQICRRLDGIPLAIELAAARMRMLSVEQIAARLDHAFHLLTGGSRSALPRHQTLQALIDWSYDLLSPDERILLMRLSVFIGGWTIDAAERVCPDRDQKGLLPTERVADLLGQLIDKSLIQFDPEAGEAPRYRILETVRQYARQRLDESGQSETLRERHLDYFLWLALQAEPHLRGPQSKPWEDRLEEELDNLRAALEWALAGSAEKGLQMAASLEWFWWDRGHSIECEQWLDRLLHEQKERFESLSMSGKAARGKALYVLSDLIGNDRGGRLYQNLFQSRMNLDRESMAIFEELGEAYKRDYLRARLNQAETISDLLECRSQFQALNDRLGVAFCDDALTNLYPPNDERRTFYLRDQLVMWNEIGDPSGEAFALSNIAAHEYYRGNLDRAIELMKASLDGFEKVGVQAATSDSRMFLIRFHLTQDNYQEANQQAKLLHAQAMKHNDLPILNRYWICKAAIAWCNGEDEEAARYGQETLELAKDLTENERLWAHYILALEAISQGESITARAQMKNLFNFLSEEFRKFVPGLFWIFLHAIAWLAALEGQIQLAATLLGALEALAGWLPNIFLPRERIENEKALAQVRTALSEETFNAAWQAGRALTQEQMIRTVQEYLAE